jgi:hypothetical protein
MKILLTASILIAATAGAAISHPPTVEQLNLVFREQKPQLISTKLEKTLISIACEGHSNGLPPRDIRRDIRKEMIRSGFNSTRNALEAKAIEITDTAKTCRN